MHAAPRDEHTCLPTTRSPLFVTPSYVAGSQGNFRQLSARASRSVAQTLRKSLARRELITSRSPPSLPSCGGVVYRRRRNSEGEDEWVGHGQSQKQEEEERGGGGVSASDSRAARAESDARARSAAVRVRTDLRRVVNVAALLATRSFTAFLFSRFIGRLLDSCKIFMVKLIYVTNSSHRFN